MKKVNVLKMKMDAVVVPPPPVIAAATVEHEEEVEVEAPLAAAPVQIGKPVGPPPPEVPLPSTFDGFMELAKVVAKSPDAIPLAKAALWIQAAQALAQKQIADRLEDLLKFLGARDTEDNEDDESPRLSDSIVNGLVGAAQVANEELLPPGAIDLLKLQLENQMQAATAAVDSAEAKEEQEDVLPVSSIDFPGALNDKAKKVVRPRK